MLDRDLKTVFLCLCVQSLDLILMGGCGLPFGDL
jgi:hypothetical protein